jgi:hypothetical protein
MPKAVTSLTGFIRKIEQIHSSASGDLFYRGHSNITHKLTPSVFRKEEWRRSEKKIIYKAMSELPKDFDGDKYFFDKLVRAQHYGIPTRLLDVTVNPLIALFFACERDPAARSQVIVLEVPKGDAKFFLSDAVSCKANIAQLTHEEERELSLGIVRSCKKVLGTDFGKKKLMDWRSSDPKKWEKIIEEFNVLKVTSRLVQFIREEKPYFDAIIDPIDLLKQDVVFPKRNNSRISAQSGAFLAFGIGRYATEKSMIRQNIIKSVIEFSSDDKFKIINALSAIGITESFVYPEFERAAAQIKKSFS